MIYITHTYLLIHRTHLLAAAVINIVVVMKEDHNRGAIDL